MINLVPPIGKKKVLREYWLRVITVWMFLLAATLFIVAAMNIPSYVLLMSLERSMSVKIEDAKRVEENFKNAEREVLATNALISHLEKSESDATFTELLDALEELSLGDISINRFHAVREDGEVNGVEISGEATTRSSLASFRDRLESSPRFEDVVLPLSSLAKDSNIPFSLSVGVNHDDV